MTTAEQTRQPAAISALLSRLTRRTPRSTYRVQFHAGFTLADAERIVDYLDALGVSDLYASPLLTARAGSGHGYDTTDHASVNPELGGDAAFERLSAALRARGMGTILDVVPNHMGIDDVRNGWWMDVLENGPSSIYAPYFDVDWDPVPAQLQNRVLLPVLGDQYGDVLERGELRLGYQDGAFQISYFDHIFPVNPRSYPAVLAHRLEQLIERLGADHPDVTDLQSIITACGYLPPRTETSPERIAERNREKEVIKRRLQRLYAASAELRAALDETLAAFNGTPGDPRSFDLLDALLDAQPYRLSFWRVATEEINYRRFFDINDLAAIRVELPDVLQATHQLVFRLLAEGKADGLRIDHPDGLWDPRTYFRQLQESYLLYLAAAQLPTDGLEVPADLGAEVRAWIDQTITAPADPARGPRWPLYVVAEKILSHGERLPDDWAVAGTTGYDWLNEMLGALVNREARRSLDRLYTDVAGPQPLYANLINAKKKEIMLVSMASELNTLAHMLDKLTERNRRYRDFTLNSLTFALREVIACLPVYRTYIAANGAVADWDARYIDAAVREARRRNPRTAAAIFDFIADTLTLRNLASFAEDAREEVRRFVMKAQQLSGPVMAKGVEDTTFYVYNRLIALNEVGGHPELFGHDVAELHRLAGERQQRWPHSLLASSTHDTKRSEDVRARIAVLSELPQEWRRQVAAWTRLNAAKKTAGEGAPMPSRNDEYFLYQSLVGAWPADGPLDAAALNAFCQRIVAYMEKATREAKVNTSWVNPNAAYDEAVRTFVGGILDPRRSRRFLDSLAAFARRAAFFGRFNSLAQTLVKLTAPGVPDIYQGCELWDLSLVDPDNRRPVDYALRRRLLDELAARAPGPELAAELLEHAPDGRIKLHVVRQALGLRRERPELFAAGDYLPLEAAGERAAHVIAYARRHESGEALAVAPRLTAVLSGGAERPPLGELWADTWLPLPHAPANTRYRDLLTGAALAVSARDGATGLPLAEILAHFPVALLVKE